MEELRLTFLVFGGLAIAAILVHGLWTVRKKNHKKRQDKPAYLDFQAQKQSEAQFEGDSDFAPDGVRSEPQIKDFDELGLGPVRVVKTADKKGVEPTSESVESPVVPPVVEAELRTQDKRDDKREEPRDTAPLPEPPASLLRKDGAATQTTAQPQPQPQPQPESKQEPMPLQEPKLQPQTRQEPVLDTVSEVQSKKHQDNSVEAEQPQAPVQRPGLAEQARNLVLGKKNDAPKRREPQMRNNKVREDQMRIDFEDEPAIEAKPDAAPAQPAKPVNQEVLVLNIKSPDNKPISGASLLPALLTLGFKFGDQDIFHRHVNSNGKGPVLFSLANMFKPGVFDVDNLETFSTQGLSLFMILPIEGDPHQVFNMMHNAARKLADEFGAQVLDGRRAVLTKQSLQQYVEKIREFERKRIIRKAN